MDTLLLSVSAFVVSILMLYWGSKRVVSGASGLSSCLNLSGVAVGTVFVASVTALPELLSCLFSVYLGSAHMALGNIIGSNIYNIPLIIGICSLLGGITIKNSNINKECYFMIGLSLVMMSLLAVTGAMTWWIGAFFVLLYPLFVYFSLRNGNCNEHTETEVRKPERSLGRVGADMVLGAGALVISTFMLVYSALSIAEFFGLNHFYVGLTIVALGCVVPEVAVSVAAALAGEEAITIGNVIGDNILTLTLVLGLVGLTSSFTVSLSELLTTAPFMLAATLLLFALNKIGSNSKLWGTVMLATAFVAFVFQTSYSIL